MGKDKTKSHIVYKNKDGQVVAGVTTVLNLLAKPALIHWAWKLGTEGQDYRKVRDKAGDIGTVAHYLIECEIKGEKPDTSEYAPADVEKAETSLLAFLEWRDDYKLDTLASELPLVSETMDFGGTLDWVSKKDGEIWLIDIKTGKAIYDEMKYQLAAYQHLWNEVHDEKIDQCYILRLSKEDGSFHYENFPNLDKEFEIFKHLLGIYKLKKGEKRK